MEINPQQFDRSDFDQITRGKLSKERLEAFKCIDCGMVLLGIPDCHFVMYDPKNLKRSVLYNRPEPFKCPNCRAVFPQAFLAASDDNRYEVSVDEVANSAWNLILKKKF
jgi:predicted RNA-binding Zn-ribbon protein involved in translation (DUF1610 family)